MLDNHPAFKRSSSLRLRKVAYRLKSRENTQREQQAVPAQSNVLLLPKSYGHCKVRGSVRNSVSFQ
ncbi:hypothetical protein [Photorhabdus hainanensis]|uniref:hypothetical protein n=2 Tax=Morganellaceae TaxID=1903414 RepID=UPI0030EE0FA3